MAYSSCKVGKVQKVGNACFSVFCNNLLSGNYEREEMGKDYGEMRTGTKWESKQDWEKKA